MSESYEKNACVSFGHFSPVTTSSPARGKTVGTKKAEPSRTQLNVLVAEDENISRLFLSRVLAQFGHQVKSVKNGREVLEILKDQEKFDVLLTDIQMPLLNGVELAQILRSDATYRHRAELPIIAMTAYAMPGDRENFLKAGMDDYLPKPIDGKLLKMVLEQLTARPQ